MCTHVHVCMRAHTQRFIQSHVIAGCQNIPPEWNLKCQKLYLNTKSLSTLRSENTAGTSPLSPEVLGPCLLVTDRRLVGRGSR